MHVIGASRFPGGEVLVDEVCQRINEKFNTGAYGPYDKSM